MLALSTAQPLQGVHRVRADECGKAGREGAGELHGEAPRYSSDRPGSLLNEVMAVVVVLRRVVKADHGEENCPCGPPYVAKQFALSGYYSYDMSRT